MYLSADSAVSLLVHVTTKKIFAKHGSNPLLLPAKHAATLCLSSPYLIFQTINN